MLLQGNEDLRAIEKGSTATVAETICASGRQTFSFKNGSAFRG